MSHEDNAATAVARPDQKTRHQTKTQKQPPYNVVLWDDNEHSYAYVVKMMQRLFRVTVQRGYDIAMDVDTAGKAVCLTTTLEHAELKRDQIRAFGADKLIARSNGSMMATVEPAR